MRLLTFFVMEEISFVFLSLCTKHTRVEGLMVYEGNSPPSIAHNKKKLMRHGNS